MKGNVDLDLRTATERERDELHAKIRTDYQSIIKELPHARPYRVMSVLGQRYGWTTQGIASLLIRTGVYTPKTATM